MDIVSPGRVPPGVMDQLRVQPRRWLHRFPAMTAKTQIYKREIQPPPGLNLWGDSLPRAQVPAVNKIHGLRPYNYVIRSTLQPDKTKATSHTEGYTAYIIFEPHCTNRAMRFK